MATERRPAVFGTDPHIQSRLYAERKSRVPVAGNMGEFANQLARKIECPTCHAAPGCKCLQISKGKVTKHELNGVHQPRSSLAWQRYGRK